MKIDVVSIFPDYLQPLHLSLVGKAIETGRVSLAVHDLRHWTHDRHRTVDDTPYGGGAGMVMKPEPWGEALDDLVSDDRGIDPSTRSGHHGQGARLLVMTPSGRPFTQALAQELSTESQLIFACGRYEGFDARVIEHARSRMRVEEVSIGDYVLNGGEVAALAIIEAVVRLIPGVIGNPESLTEESYSAGHEGLLEYPVYTKPPQWRGLDVPEILFSGHHGRIAEWRREQAVERTAERRPDLLPAERRPVVLAPATVADAGELLTLQYAAYLAEGRRNGSMDIPPLVETLAQIETVITQTNHDSSIFLVARRGDRLVGSVRGNVADDGTWLVGRLLVAPDQQRSGLGSLLLQASEAASPAEVRASRLVTGAASTTNLRFYTRRGYVEIDRLADEAGVAIVRLVKSLD